MADEIKPTRRTFFGTCIGLLTFGLVQPKPKLPASPWAERADELRETEGFYGDYTAWLEWADEHWCMSDGEPNGSLYSVGYYDLCCEAIEQDRKLRRDDPNRKRGD